MSGEGAFMMWSGRRVEWPMVHPAFREIFAFGLHGAELCAEFGIHPMFPLSEEVEQIRQIIHDREEALV